MLYPFWHVVMQSFSSMEGDARAACSCIVRKGFNLDTYRFRFQ